MDEAMLRFNEKLKQLLDVAKKKKNVLEYTEINQFFSDMELSTEKIELIYEYLEQNGVDILTIPQDDDDDAEKGDSMPMSQSNIPAGEETEIIINEKGDIVDERIRNDLPR